MDYNSMLDMLNIFAFGFVTGFIWCPIWGAIKQRFLKKDDSNQ